MRNLILILSIITTTCSLKSQDVIRLSRQDHVVDLTKNKWDFVAYEPGIKTDYKEVSSRKDWKTIKVGKRWEFLDHPELKDKTVWVKLFFDAPLQLKNYQLGFFASMIDDEGTVFLNGDSAGAFQYKTGGKIPRPVNVNLTPHLKWGAENELVIEIRDVSTQRMGGMLGSVCLYRTLPNKLTAEGSIALQRNESQPLAVLLHLGDAQLVKGAQKNFTQKELTALQTPPSILRSDELIIVTPAKDLALKKYLAVDLNNVNPTTSNDSLHVQCGTLPEKTGLYELLKIPVTVSGSYTNPFDPKQITVQAIIETPSGHVEKVFAFFGQDFDQVIIGKEEEILLPVKGNPWKLYYRPREKGVHKIEILAQDKNALKRIAAGSFEATASNSRGYLHKSKVEPRLYEFDNGDMHYGKGPSGWFRGSNFMFGGNIRWVPLKLLTEYYERKAANGSNFEYLATFHFGSLYINNGFIDQHVAWKQEEALRSMEKNGLYWIVFHDGVLRSYQNGFETMPYAAANGGPCKNIYEVYAHPVALEMQKNELRYMISRWADSPSLWIWNCGDESQPGTQLSKLMVRDWLKELHAYIRQTDIYKHSHSAGEYEDAILNGGDVVLLGDWYYHNNNRGDKYDQMCNGEKSQNSVAYNLCLQEGFKEWEYPVVNIEGGICQWENFSWLSGEKYKKFPEAIDFHQHLWISFFTKMAAGGTEWLCQAVNEMNELYHAKALDNFIKDESLTKTFHRMVTPQISKDGLLAFGLQTAEKSLVWINNDFYNWFNIGVHKKRPVSINNASIRIDMEKDGNYKIEEWDTRKGTVIKTTEMKSSGGQINYALPSIAKDLALKVIATN